MDAGVLPSAVADATAVLARCWATSVPVGEARIGNETLELQPPGQASAAAVDAFRTLEAFAREQVVRLAPEGELLMERLPRRACSTSLVRVSRLDALDAHCDSSIATLVVASAPGLEVMTTQGQWQPAPFVCLLRGSDLPRPTVHRVVAAAPRESVCFFVRSEAFPEAGQGWAQLPLPVLAVLVRKLGPLEVIHLSGVCRRFRRALENPHLWLSLAAAEEIQLPPNIELGRVRERCLLSLFPRIHHVPFVTFDLPKPKRDVAGAQRQNLKLVCVGDSGTGKSSLLRYMARTRGGQSDDMWHAVQLTEPDLTCTLSMWDTNGATEYERLRPLSYPPTDVFVVVFSLASRESLERVKTQWVPEVSLHCPHTPVVLVGAKADCERVVTAEEAVELARQLRCMGYFEASCLRDRGVAEAFEFACRTVVHRSDPVDAKFPHAKKCALQ